MIKFSLLTISDLLKLSFYLLSVLKKKLQSITIILWVTIETINVKEEIERKKNTVEF